MTALLHASRQSTQCSRNKLEERKENKRLETPFERSPKIDPFRYSKRLRISAFKEFQTATVSRFVVHHYTDRLAEPPSLPDDRQHLGVDLRRASSFFPGTLYFILQQATGERYTHIISWKPHGRCFKVHDQQRFVEEILPKFTNQSQYPSFRRQLNLYGFTKLSCGMDQGSYYQEYFLRGRPDLLPQVKRVRLKGTKVRRTRVHSTEPDFYSMPPCPDNSDNSVDTNEGAEVESGGTEHVGSIEPITGTNIPVAATLTFSAPQTTTDAEGAVGGLPVDSRVYEPTPFETDDTVASYGIHSSISGRFFSIPPRKQKPK